MRSDSAGDSRSAVKKIRLGAATYRHIKTLSESNQVVGVDYPGHTRYEWADGQDKVRCSCRACNRVPALEMPRKILHRLRHPRGTSPGL